MKRLPLSRRQRLCRAGALLAASTALVAAGAVPAWGAGPGGVTVTSSAELDPLFQNSHVVGRDNGQSAGYEGSSVWIFDDTMLRDPDGFISNSGARTRDLNAADGITVTSDNPFTVGPQHTPEEIIARTPSESAFEDAHSSANGCTTDSDPLCGSVFGFWPGPVVADPARHRILTTYGKLCRGSAPGTACASDFVGQPLGMGILALDMKTHRAQRLTESGLAQPIGSAEGADPTLLFPPEFAFGGTAAVVVNGMFYGYGACTNFLCAVGRVPLADVMNRSKWRYYAGDDGDGRPRWSSDPADAKQVMESGAAGGTVSWNPAMHAYLDIYMDGISSQAVYRTAPTPWGPWSDKTVMFTGTPTNTLWDYACYSHAEYQQRDGLTQYVTYYNPQDTQQHLVKVEFSGRTHYDHVLVPHPNGAKKG
jgi:hypothetical protein